MTDIVPPNACTTMSEIRTAIDALDREIVALLAKRMRYIDAAARVKSAREAVRDEDRKADVIAKACDAADAHGLSREHVAAIYELLVERSIAHEFRVFDSIEA
ncbi:chorismate mutase [Sphingosinicella microcystinivorans]|uniref:chorismate mutase n=1 Tax=Sphingosinicella microcystinivorans TaxID=335406 RepID=A0AAD1D741_SPHMI|nr:chorismate mutase [Sphingosinicella microcystinivorans]RKS91878.1 isochorismate pyruvate lyase [Sphingosinicella microcystinivorans]BBE34864.1 chorismate mutase [Sphingosinicella microcystinivorans]